MYEIIKLFYGTNGGTGKLAVGHYSNEAADAQLYVPLGDYSGNYTSLESAVNSMPFIGGRTNLQRATDSVIHDINNRQDLTIDNTAILVISDGQVNEGVKPGATVFQQLLTITKKIFAILVIPPNGFYENERMDIQAVLNNQTASLNNSVVAQGYFQLKVNANTSTSDNDVWAANKLCGF